MFMGVNDLNDALRSSAHPTWTLRELGLWGCFSVLESPEFSPGSSAENVQSIKVLSFGNEFREVMAVRVNQEKFRKGIA